MAQNTIALIDGHSLFHRAFFALPLLTNSRGQPTNAVYGFLTMLYKLLDDQRPSHLAVTLDRSAPTFRHEAYTGYKAHRPGMPDDLRAQSPLLRQALEVMGVPIFELDGWEADDLLGTLAGRAAAVGFQVLLVTGDRDLLQLVGPGVKTVLTKKGITEMEIYDEAAVRERYGLSPAQLVDVKALMGDASDNIPGIPGVGEKTALKLIQRFGSLDEIYRRAGEVPGTVPAKVAAAVLEAREQAEMARHLATIDRDAPLAADLEACRRLEPDRNALYRLFTELEFGTLVKRLGLAPAQAPAQAAPGAPGGARQGDIFSSGGEAADTVQAPPDAPAPAPHVAWHQAFLPEGVRDAEALLQVAAEDGSTRLALAFGRAGDRPPALALCPDVEADTSPGGRPCLLIPAAPDQGEVDLARGLGPLLARPGLCWEGHDLKALVRLFRRHGQEAGEGAFDTAVAAYLLDATRTSYRLEDLVRTHLGYELPPLGEGAPDALAAWASLAARAVAIPPLRRVLAEALKDRGLADLFQQIEMPLVPILAEMEEAGVTVDPAVLEELGGEFSSRVEELAAEIHGMAGRPFNINSPQQLGEVLFKDLGLPTLRKTKTGYSTDAAVLEELAARHPIAARVVEYRHLVKLLGTYVEGLKPLISPRTGRVHSTFHQTVTATGRLSSADPNLQNIPVREALGRRLRRAFVAPPGCLLVAADYSQIELRILAHVAGDDGLIRAFHEGADIHRATAAEVFGIPREEVTDELRDRAKATNFGIVYGISDFGLSQNLGIGRAEAREFMDRYFARYPGVRRYLDQVVERAREEGEVRTLFQRVRALPEIQSRVYARRQFAERTAMNTPIQGTAADIIKLAMIRVWRELKERRLASRLVLQVHDELIVEAPEAELDAVRDLLVEAMEGVVTLSVPLKVEVKAGPNWYDMR